MKKCDWYKAHMRCIHCKVLYPRPIDVDVRCPTRNNTEHPKCPQCNRPLRLRPPHKTLYRDMGKTRMRTECIYMTDWKFVEKLRMELLRQQ